MHNNGQNNQIERQNGVIETLQNYVRIVRQKKQVLFLIQSLLVAIAVYIIVSPIELSPVIQYFVIAMTGILFFAIKLRSTAYQAVRLENILEHCNRQFKDYEESAQLILIDDKDLSQLQQLQKSKLHKKIKEDIGSHRITQALPSWSWKSLNFPVLAVVVAAAFSYLVLPNLPSESLKSLQAKLEKATQKQTEKQLPAIVSAEVTVLPPTYTNLPKQTLQGLNLEVLEGSEITWEVRLADNDHEVKEWYLIDAEQNKFKLTNKENGFYLLNKTVDQTTFYRFAYLMNSEENSVPVPLADVYSIAVTKDQLPKIRIVEPNQTLVELPKSEDASFSIEAHIKDDFGIGDVSILASVAKGSGEAVKFRDETFQFDSFATQDDKQVYLKSWSLKSLGMEPGDEVYFSVVAFDNKQPQAQRSKSSSVIVRWLDDEIIETAAEGIQIRFIPEFFRSQRQIIIETEQLIADKKDLFPTVFRDKSEDLGFSQRDLKEKYGQYLGDEFGEGPAPDSVVMHGLADGYHGGEDVAQGEATAGLASHLEHLYEKDEHKNHEGESNHNHSNEASVQAAGHGHEHGNEDPFGNSMVDSSDKSGASELIAQFAHNHGSAEIGPMSKRDPKSWMKRAVSVMWQAELHLMMHEPEKALPYEYEAYQYLKLARQADKIYVKRLGFEPPPVKESARLTGELKDILTYELSVEDSVNSEADSVIIASAYRIINDPNMRTQLSLNAKNTLIQLRDRLLKLAEQRPILINYATTVEKILVAGSLKLSGCENCINKLKAKLWQMSSRPISLPNVRDYIYEQANERHQDAVREYLNAIEKLNLSHSKSGAKND